MATNLAIDDDLLKEAQLIGKLATKKATVNEALKEFIARRKRQKSLESIGTLNLDETFDYKKERKHR